MIGITGRTARRSRSEQQQQPQQKKQQHSHQAETFNRTRPLLDCSNPASARAATATAIVEKTTAAAAYWSYMHLSSAGKLFDVRYDTNSLLWPCSSYKPTKNSLFCCCCFIYCSKNQLLSGMIIFCGQLDLQAELRDDVVASSNIIRNKRNIIRSICQKM